jgi:hypothetical protein
METRNDQSKRPQSQPEPPKKPKSRLERWIEKLEERIAPHIKGGCYYDTFNHHGKDVGPC